MQRLTGMDLSRRDLLAGAVAIGAAWPAVPAWADAIHNVHDHGAFGDGEADDTAAIQHAIDAAAPGGVVVFPPGTYRSGTLRLRSRLTLRLAAGAALLASPDDRDFEPREKLPYDTFAGDETSDFAFALLQGRGLQHVTILGPGRIDGNRRARGGPKPIALKACRDVTIRDVTLENAPNYTISLLGCEHVDIVGVTIRHGYADGIDPDCCRYVRIASCRVESRDDAICLKSSLALGARRPTEYVVVTDCTLTNVRNALKIGSESGGDIRHIVFRDCTLTGRAEPLNVLSLGLAPHPSAGVSLECVDGGRVEHLLVSGITMRNMRTPLFVRLGQRGAGQAVPTAGTLGRITIRDVTATGAVWPSSITGVPGHDVADVSLRDVRITGKGGGAESLRSFPVPERERGYPDATRFRLLPAHSLYCRHVTDLRVERTSLTVERADARPALVLDDVRGARVSRLSASAPADGGPVAWVRASRECVLDPELERLALRLDG